MFSVLGCATAAKDKNHIISYMGGTHKLHKMFSETTNSMTVNGYYFLFAGGISGKLETQTLIRFAWKTNDGTYSINSMSLNNVRVRLVDDTLFIPTIEFVYDWIYVADTPQDLQYMINQTKYSVITCCKRDWNYNIQLPMNPN